MSLIRLIIFFILFSINKIYCQKIQFYREDLTFEIRNDYFSVNGIYNFCNNSESQITQVLFYPFPIDSMYGTVDSISVYESNSEVNKLITTNKISKNGFYFNVELNGYGVNKYKISYRQKLLNNKAEYILLSTQKWERPFDYAFYKLIVPESKKINYISYSPDSTTKADQKIIYYWTKKNFMPDKNMIIYFDK